MMPMPLLVSHVLELLGVHGQIALLVSAALGLYHFREALGLAAVIGTWLRMAAVFVVLVVVGMTGIVPGYRVELPWWLFEEGAKLGQQGVSMAMEVLG